MSRKKGKRSRENESLQSSELTAMEQAIPMLRRFKAPKFDQTVNVVAHLGIDPKQADQALRGSISMPHGIGKSATVIAFCPADKVDEAKAAGAIEAGGEELVAKIAEGWMEFDVAVATRAIGTLSIMGFAHVAHKLFPEMLYRRMAGNSITYNHP